MNNTGPIISCSDGGDRYEVKLSRARAGEDELGFGIGFEIFIKWSGGSKTRVPWGKAYTTSEHNSWWDWEIEFVRNKEPQIRYAEGASDYKNWNSRVPGCGRDSILVEEGEPVGDETKKAKATEIKIKLEKCAREFFTKTCDITFSSGSDLKF